MRFKGKFDNFKSTLLQKILIKNTHSITYTNTRPKLLCFRRRKQFQKETVVVSTDINILLHNYSSDLEMFKLI
jgi:hypothetical protein